MIKRASVIILALAAQFALAEPPSVEIAKRAIQDQMWRDEGRTWKVNFSSAKKRDLGRDRVEVTGEGFLSKSGSSRRNFTFDVLVDTSRERAIDVRYDFSNTENNWSEQESRQLVEDRVISQIRDKYGRSTRITIRKSNVNVDRNSHMATGNGYFTEGKNTREFSFDSTVDPVKGRISRFNLDIGRATGDKPTNPTMPVIRTPEDAAREAVRARIASNFGNQYDLRFWAPNRKDLGNLVWEISGDAEVTSVGGTKRKFKYRCVVNKKDNVVSETTINYYEQ